MVEISKIIKFFQKFFKHPGTNEPYQTEILNNTKVSISREQQMFCNNELDLAELEEGMKQLPLGQSPGLDGSPVEFYKCMWPVIKNKFIEMVKEAQKLKYFSDTQKKGVIWLIFKKEDSSDQT